MLREIGIEVGAGYVMPRKSGRGTVRGVLKRSGVGEAGRSIAGVSRPLASGRYIYSRCDICPPAWTGPRYSP